jgi:hypothetical protein
MNKFIGSVGHWSLVSKLPRCTYVKNMYNELLVNVLIATVIPIARYAPSTNEPMTNELLNFPHK